MSNPLSTKNFDEDEIDDGWSRNLKESLEDIAPDVVFKITGVEGEYNILTYDSKTEEWEKCALVSIGEGDMHVTDVAKTSVISGKEILEGISKCAEEIGITLISLEDVSSIDLYCQDKSISFSLAVLKILTKGQSWYNSLGYKSFEYKQEVKKNKVILNTPFTLYFRQMISRSDALNNLMSSYKYVPELKFNSDNLVDQGEEILQQLIEMDEFSDLNQLSVKEFVTRVESIIKKFQISDCDNFYKLQILEYVIIVLSSGIMYNHLALYKNLTDD